jgi:hypothetical protein
VIAASVALMATFFVGRAIALPQPYLESALGNLEQAKALLAKAEHNKGGFRDQAIGEVEQAISAVREDIDAGRHR